MMKKIIAILACAISMHQMTPMSPSIDYSILGKAEEYDSLKRHAIVSRLSNTNCHEHKAEIEAEFFMQCQKNNKKIVEHLLSVVGVDPNIRNADEDTALVVAIRHGAREVAELLLQHGADPLQLVEDVPGNWVSLQTYVAQNHDDFLELICNYIAHKYAPTAPPMNEFEQAAFEEDIITTKPLPAQDRNMQDESNNKNYFNRVSDFIKNNKAISGIVCIGLAGLAYKYIQSKKSRKQNT